LDHFDCVVIGGGAGGRLISKQLSADGNRRVLLLELAAEAHSLAYVTEPQEFAAYRRFRWPRLHLLGHRPGFERTARLDRSALDFDAWAAAGCPGWNYNSIQDTLGALNTGDPDRGAIGIDHLLAGRMNWQAESGAAQRRQTDESWSRAAAPPNLTVLNATVINRLGIECDRVRTVEYQSGGRTHLATVGAEAVLCAGVIETPRILMSSGIGPVGQLESVGIRTLVEAPEVGANLQDQLGIGIAFQSDPRTSTHGMDCLPGALHSVESSRTGSQVTLDVADTTRFVGGGSPSALRCHIRAICTTPESRGFVTPRSASVAHPPAIDPRYLSSRVDLEGLVDALALAKDLAASSGLRADCQTTALSAAVKKGRETLKDYVRRSADSTFHVVGTCRMGGDAGAVVDEDLKLRGVENLRVADASVMPIVPVHGPDALELVLALRASSLLQAAS